jgi:hypothetical protein
MAAEKMCKLQGLNQETPENLVQETGVLAISTKGGGKVCSLRLGLWSGSSLSMEEFNGNHIG